MRRGFTTIELLFVVGISLLVIAAMLGGFVNFMIINEHNRNLTIAMNIARDKMEQVITDAQSGNFDSIVSTSYNAASLATAYSVPANWGSCAVTITNINNDLKYVRMVVCWRDRGNRRIGEDFNLNGVLDSGEDSNNNGLIDSPCVLYSAVARK